jgi:hypothetical protein
VIRRGAWFVHVVVDEHVSEWHPALGKVRIPVHRSGAEMATIVCSAHALRAAGCEAACQIEILNREDSAYPATASFVEAAYVRAYGTRIAVTYPCLLRVVSEGGQTIAAAGMRHAAGEPLYLEHLFAQPIERVLAGTYGKPVRRDGIWELGNMASTGKGGGTYLFLAVYQRLCDARADYLVVVATQKLRARCAQLGFGVTHLGRVSEMRLSGAQQIGRYIDLGQPEVLALDTQSLHPAFAGLGVELEEQPFPALDRRSRVTAI